LAAIVPRAGIAIAALAALNHGVHTTGLWIAGVVRALVVVVAVDRRVVALPGDARVLSAQIGVVAANPAATTVLDVVLEIWSDNVTVRLVGGNGALIDFDLHKRVLLRVCTVADRDFVIRFLGGRTGLVALVGPRLRGFATGPLEPSQASQDP